MLDFLEIVGLIGEELFNYLNGWTVLESEASSKVVICVRRSARTPLKVGISFSLKSQTDTFLEMVGLIGEKSLNCLNPQAFFKIRSFNFLASSCSVAVTYRSLRMQYMPVDKKTKSGPLIVLTTFQVTKVTPEASSSNRFVVSVHMGMSASSLLLINACFICNFI